MKFGININARVWGACPWNFP